MWVKFVFSSRPCSERFFSEQLRIQGRPPSNLFLDETEARKAGKKGTPVLSTFSSKSNNLNFHSVSNACH